MLARMSDAEAAGRDPEAALSAPEAEWVAAHLDACPACSLAGDPAAASLLGALRALGEADAPDDAFFAERRAAIMARVLETDAAGRTSRGRRQGVERAATRRRWMPVALALAAGLALVLATTLRRAPGPERPAVAPQDASEVEVELPDAGALPDVAAEDVWAAAGDDPLLELATATDRSLRDLRDLTDEELDEIEGLLLSVPGWS